MSEFLPKPNCATHEIPARFSPFSLDGPKPHYVFPAVRTDDDLPDKDVLIRELYFMPFTLTKRTELTPPTLIKGAYYFKIWTDQKMEERHHYHLNTTAGLEPQSLQTLKKIFRIWPKQNFTDLARYLQQTKPHCKLSSIEGLTFSIGDMPCFKILPMPQKKLWIKPEMLDLLVYVSPPAGRNSGPFVAEFTAGFLQIGRPRDPNHLVVELLAKISLCSSDIDQIYRRVEEVLDQDKATIADLAAIVSTTFGLVEVNL